MRTRLALVTLLALMPSELNGQYAAVAPPRFPAASAGSGNELQPFRFHLGADQQVSDADLAWAGVLGGVLGLAAGGLAGAWIGGEGWGCREYDDLCGLVGAVFGAVIGESAGVPLAVHLRNGRRGNYFWGWAASTGIGLAGFTIAVAADFPTETPAIFIATPAAQLATSVAIEKATAK